MGGKSLLPTTDFHFNIIQIEENRITDNEEIGKVYEGCQSNIWFPIIKSEDLSELVEFDDQSKKVASNMRELFPKWDIDNGGNEFQKCWTINYKRQQVYDKDCKTVKSCINCIWQKKPVLRLRGLCRKSEIENHYTVVTGFNHDGVFGK